MIDIFKAVRKHRLIYHWTKHLLETTILGGQNAEGYIASDR